MEYLEIEQDDLTDSEMLDVIREKMLEGWALSEYKWADGIKTWLFEKPHEPRLTLEYRPENHHGIQL